MAKKAHADAETINLQPSIPVHDVSSGRKPFVFVSHDSRDAALAEAFGNLLTDASGGILKSFRSSDKRGTAGIEFGAEWYKAIMSKLDTATDVVALLTHNSLDRPWILYEAGVAKGKLSTTVFGIALGIPLDKATTGPFAQFQNCADDEDALTSLVLQLIRKNPDASPREEAVRRQVKAFLDHEGALLKTSKPKTSPSTPLQDEQAAVAKMFEEVKILVRELPEKLDARKGHNSRTDVTRRRRFDPGIAEIMLFQSPFFDSPDGAALPWLMFISLLRDDFPWFYEIGVELYQALRTHNIVNMLAAQEQLIKAVDFIVHSPFMRETMASENHELFMFMRHLRPMLEEFFRRCPSPHKRHRLTKPAEQGEVKK
jgi:hypothetical protein